MRIFLTFDETTVKLSVVTIRVMTNSAALTNNLTPKCVPNFEEKLGKKYVPTFYLE